MTSDSSRQTETQTGRSSEKAEAIVTNAQRKAEEIIERARTEAREQIREAQRFDQNSLEGVDELQVLLRTQIDEAYRELPMAIYRGALRAVDNGLTQLFDDQEALFGFILYVLETSVGHAKEVILRVHPDVEEQLSASGGRLQTALRGAGSIEIRGDRHLDRAGIVIETESGVIDAQPSTQLQSIAQILGVETWRA